MSSGRLALPLASDDQRRVLGDWNISGVYGSFPAGVLIELERAADQASLQIVLTPKGTQALTQTPFGAISYRKYANLTSALAVDTTRKFAELLKSGALPFSVLFPHLAFESTPKADDRETYLALIAPKLKLLPGEVGEGGLALLPKSVRQLHFDPPGLVEFLSPELAPDGAPVMGFVLKAIYLPATGKREALDFSSYVLDFAHAKTGESVRVRLSARSSNDAFARIGELSLNMEGFAGNQEQLPSSVTSLSSWLLTLIRLKSADGLDLTVPTVPEEVRALSVPAGRGETTRVAEVTSDARVDVRGPPEAFNLAIDSDCDQQCAFCSVKSYVKPVDGGATELDAIRLQLRTVRKQGVEEVRLNGIDPLTFSGVLDVVEEVRALGFRRLSVYSPCRRFADATFRREFLRRAPRELHVTVPLYGVTAATHDAVTGAPGSFAQAMTAIETLIQETSTGSVAISTVIVKQNLHEAFAIARFTAERGLKLHCRLSYPMKATTRDPYADSAVREHVVVDHLLRHLDTLTEDRDRELAADIAGRLALHPCLLWRAEQRVRLPVLGLQLEFPKRMLPGTEYRQSKFVHSAGNEGTQTDAFAVATVPCPHLDRCALAPVCPGEHYAVYRQLFGLDEFAPVTVPELYGSAKRS